MRTPQPFPYIIRVPAVQVVVDAGCCAEFIQEYLEISGSGGTPVRLRLLEGQRKELLGQLHVQQRKLDCLDWS